MTGASFRIIFGVLAVFLFSVTARAELPMQSFAPLVKKTSPAVVNIFTKKVVQESTRLVSPFFNDPFFNQFFNAPQFSGPVRNRVESSLGSGVIVDAGGLIATNNHVIKDAQEISVVMSDGREFPAQKMLADARTDLAVLKIDTKGEKLPVLELTDSDAVEVGDIVLAIGNPFGVGQTVTSGIVSGLARTDVGVSDYSFFIQTDAAINPGNSGGALIDTQGRLIGINSAIFSKTGGSLGIGFAIPANMVKTVVNAAEHGSKIVRPWTGLTSQPVTSDMLEGLKLKKAQGALIKQVSPDGPAAKAGIKTGDVILSINGKDVQDPAALKFRLATIGIGSPITLGISRAGKEQDVTFMAEAPPETTPKDETLIKGVNPLNGAVVANLSPALLEDIGQLALESGVVVLEVKGGDAANLGIQKGDIVLSVNGQKVTSVKRLLGILKPADTRKWTLQLQRGAQTINVNIAR